VNVLRLLVVYYLLVLSLLRHFSCEPIVYNIFCWTDNITGIMSLAVDCDDRNFPACRFGDTCLFIHPNCKFDVSCRNARCPYTHSCPRRPSGLSPAAVPVIVQPVRSELVVVSLG